jgi:predicted nucleotidyltransferase
MTEARIIRGKNMKVDDTLPALRVKLFEAGDPFNLDEYTVNMRMKRTDSDSLIVDQQITVDDPSKGIVEYSWSAGDTDTSGTYLLEFVADDGSSTITFPNSDYTRLYIEDGLDT